MLSPANFLILDEPTNHLDIQSKEILEDAIRNYTGTVLVVSHDRYFINAISSRIVELKDNRLYTFIGNYDYYESHKEMVYANSKNENSTGTAKAAAADENSVMKTGNQEEASSSSKEQYLKNKEEQARIRKKENQINRVEAAIERLEEEICAIDDEINNPENATNSLKLGELSAKRQKASDELDELMEKWEELCS
jgi:ATP-binding cassette subfamily F protein 3